jgi:hypothetical protein
MDIIAQKSAPGQKSATGLNGNLAQPKNGDLAILKAAKTTKSTAALPSVQAAVVALTPKKST